MLVRASPSGFAISYNFSPTCGFAFGDSLDRSAGAKITSRRRKTSNQLAKSSSIRQNSSPSRRNSRPAGQIVRLVRPPTLSAWFCPHDFYSPAYNAILVLNLFLFVDHVSKAETRWWPNEQKKEEIDTTT